MLSIKAFIAALATAVLGLGVAYSFAQQKKPVLVAKRDLAIFPSPRNGLFCQHGKQIGQLRKGEEVVSYEELKAFCGPFYSIEYIKISYTGADGLSAAAYVRRRENDGKDRFQLKAEQGRTQPSAEWEVK